MPKFTTTDGQSLYYTDQGTGLPMICLSGLTRNGADFGYALPVLQGCRVIRPDYRGRGRSDWAKDYSTYNIVREAQDVLELMDFLGLEKAAFLGTSRGGLISLTLGVMARARMLGVCFVDVGPVIETAGLEVILGFLGRNPSWKTHDQAAEVFGSRMVGFDNVPQSRWRQEVEMHFVQTDDGLTINYDPKLRDATLAVFDPNAAPPDLWPLYDALAELPVAAIRGANSDLFSVQTLAQMQARRPDLIATTVPDRGHVPFLDEAESVVVLKNWIKELETAP